MDVVEKPPVKAPPPPPPEATKTHIKTLDWIVQTNSLFAFTSSFGFGLIPLFPPDGCVAVKKSMVIFNLCSLSSLVFSSLVALSLKKAIRGGTLVNKTAVRAGMIISDIGTASGVVFMTLAFVSTVARALIERGRLSCGDSLSAYAAKEPMLIVPFPIVLPALLIYLFNVIRARTR
ncbi:hypothetical protein QJS04_geneDACA007664 [Acorus gramineus]|uniref:Uncharacterized protein n=1 Tax=Acorus gramineus TaxID=55184 RepID=A0AAV9B0Q5_ACOGR|nr:hypothetical protein QJS04_geneDACA007664 [Acorus gramineus]